MPPLEKLYERTAEQGVSGGGGESGGGGAWNCAGGRGLPNESVLPISSAFLRLGPGSSSWFEHDDCFLAPLFPVGRPNNRNVSSTQKHNN